MTHPAWAALTFLCWEKEMSSGIFSSGSKSENTSKISHTPPCHQLAKNSCFFLVYKQRWEQPGESSGDITQQVTSNHSSFSTNFCFFCLTVYSQTSRYSRENKKMVKIISGQLLANEMAQSRVSCLGENHPGTSSSLKLKPYSVDEYRHSPRPSIFKLFANI